jgi:hypothetical protein
VRETRLLPVRIVGDHGATPEVLEIELLGGRRLRVPATLDPAVLGRFIEALERSTC